MTTKQADIELLYYYAYSYYEQRHSLSNQTVLDLFDKYHVFEKMLSQYEYLHQIPIEEVMDYVESLIIQEKKSLCLYHGTVALFDRIDLGQSENRRDFGIGFYTTVIEAQALDWAQRKQERTGSPRCYVYVYEYIENPELNILHFHGPDQEWLEFVKNNRINGGCEHSYDIVIGPVADDKTMRTLMLYISDTISAEEAVKRLRYSLVNNQVSFHTEKAIACLTQIRRKTYE